MSEPLIQSHQINVSGVSSNISLNHLSDVNTSGVSDGTSLVFSSTANAWIPQQISVSTTLSNLNDIGDVNVSSAQEGDVLKYISGMWIAQPETVGSGSPATFPQYLGGLQDVITAGASTNDVLTYDGTTWTPAPVPTTSNSTTFDLRVNNSTVGTVADGGHINFLNGSNISISGSGSDITINSLGGGTVTYSAGQGIDISGTLISHSDTSTQGSVSNSGNTFIQSVTVDTFGHITNITSGTVTNTGDGNNFVTSVSFDDSNGELTIARDGLATINTTLDGRYSLLTHDHAGVYATAGHTHTEYAPLNHTHNNYAQTVHSHDWGTITGTISNQTDLNNALLLKLNATTNTFDNYGTVEFAGNGGTYFGSEAVLVVDANDLSNSVAGSIVASSTGTGLIAVTSDQDPGSYAMLFGHSDSQNVYSSSGTGYHTFGFICGNDGISEKGAQFIQGSKYVNIVTPTYGIEVVGGASGTFTAGHDGLWVKDNTLPEVGDIIIDVEVYHKDSVFDTICVNDVSNVQNQKGAIGVFTQECTDYHIPSTLRKTDTIDGKIISSYKPEFAHVLEDYKIITFNSLGEGQINVCGENGDIEIGDLIATSSIPGKGMKQSDDFIKNITVAKSRENVTFSSPTEVKQIACVYMCG